MTAPDRIVVVACATVVLNMTGFLPVAAVLPMLFEAFALTESKAGWLTGSAFAAYAIMVPVFTALTDRIDARPVVILSLLVGAIAGLGFALFATDFWSALGFRVLAGIGFAGMHFPGLKMLADRLAPERAVRGSALYVSMFSLGSAASFLLSGLVVAFAPWPWVFASTGLCSAAGAVLIWLCVEARPAPVQQRTAMPDFPAVCTNVEAMRYVLAYFGHLWEMFAFRNWFVVFMALSTGLAHNTAYQGWNIPLLGAITALAAWPASIAVSELAQRFSRDRVIMCTVLTSLTLAIVLSQSRQLATPLLLALTIFYSMTAFGDSGALASGLISKVEPRIRGAALALYALLGFCGGALGPAAVGWVMQLAGGRTDPRAWVAGWLTIGAGTLVVSGAITLVRKREAR